MGVARVISPQRASKSQTSRVIFSIKENTYRSKTREHNIFLQMFLKVKAGVLPYSMHEVFSWFFSLHFIVLKHRNKNIVLT